MDGPTGPVTAEGHLRRAGLTIVLYFKLHSSKIVLYCTGLFGGGGGYPKNCLNYIFKLGGTILGKHPRFGSESQISVDLTFKWRLINN